jgi:carbon monoxide dehydrogenase subunit G
MAVVSGSIDISVSPEKVYDYIASPEKATAFIPGLNRISNVSPPGTDIGRTWDYEFNWFGLVIAGNSRCTQANRPNLYQFQTVTGNRSTWTYHFAPQGGGTHLTLEVEYDVPASMLARYATEGTLAKMNQDRGSEALANLKALLE